MLMLVSCIVVASCYFIMNQLIAFKFYPDLNELEQVLAKSWCHQIELTSATTFAFYGKVLTRSIVMPLAGASNEGRLCVGATLAG